MLLALGFEESVSLGIHVAQYLDLWHPDWEPVSVEMSGMGWGSQQTLRVDVCIRVAPQLWSGYGQSLDLTGPSFLHLQDRLVLTVDMGCH